MNQQPPSANVPPDAPMSAGEALRMALRLTGTEEDVHTIARMVLALVGADEDLVGDDADAALERAGISPPGRRPLVAALGPAGARPGARELRSGLRASLRDAAVEGRASGVTGLFRELRARRVTRTALLYVGASVAIVEAANLFLPMLGVSSNVVRMLAIAAVFGVPVALTLAWNFDVVASRPARASGARTMRIALIGGVCAVCLLGASWIWYGGAGATVDGEAVAAANQPAADPAHIAVLDFEAVGGGDDLADFADQLQARLIDGLSAAAMEMEAGGPSQLRVLSLAGVRPFMGPGLNVDSLREARGVGLALQGSVEQGDDALRVRVRMLDTRTGDQIHTSTTRVPAGDRLALLDAVADSVLHLVRTRLGPVVREHVRLLETRSRPAFDHLTWATGRLRDELAAASARGDYATARALLGTADSLLAEAERLDPAWVEPVLERARLAEAAATIAAMLGDAAAVPGHIERGVAHAERALGLEAEDPRALERRGALRHLGLQVGPSLRPSAARALRRQAEADLRASLMRNPAPAHALRVLSELAAADGRFDEAVRYGERALAHDPFMEQAQITLFRLAEHALAAGRDADAARWCAEGRDRFGGPLFDDCRLSLAAWSSDFGLAPDSAWAVARTELDAYPPPLRPRLEPRLHAMLAAVHVRAGQPDSARALLRDATRADRSAGVLRAAAGVHAMLGQPDSAIALLREVMLQAGAPEPRALRAAPEMRPLLTLPAARALLDADD